MRDLARPELREFARELTALLETRGMNKTALADEVNVSNSTVTNWTAGKARPTPANVEAAEDALVVNRGHLAKFLGYQPLREKVPLAESYEEYLIREGLLSDEQRRVLVQQHEYMLWVQAQLRQRPREPGQ